MREAGAIFIGKTNTPEFGLGSHTYNPVYGATHNAYDQSNPPAAAAAAPRWRWRCACCPSPMAATMAAACAIPAGWNNVFGFRTSLGVVPVAGEDVWLPSMGVAGPMARNISDLALLLSVQAGYDARAPLSLDGEGSRFRGAARCRHQGQAHRLAGRLWRLGALRSRRAGCLPRRAEDIREHRLQCRKALPDGALEPPGRPSSAPPMAAGRLRCRSTTTDPKTARCSSPKRSGRSKAA